MLHPVAIHFRETALDSMGKKTLYNIISFSIVITILIMFLLLCRFGNMVAFFRYSPINILTVFLPPSMLEFNSHPQPEWIRTEAAEVGFKKKHLNPLLHVCKCSYTCVCAFYSL